MKLLTDFNQFRKLGFYIQFKRWRGCILDTFPCLKQTSILLNQLLAGGKNYFLPILFFSTLFLVTLFSFAPEEAFSKGEIGAISIKDPQGKEEKRLASENSEGMGVSRLRPGHSQTSPKKLTGHEGMVSIPAGRYVYGESGSQKNMVLDAFYMDVQEVTQKNYEQVMGKNPSKFKGENLPVEKVTWQEAKEYCQRIGKRLPTSREWEKAARAGTSSKYYWGNTLGKNKANCNDCGSQWDGLKTAPVHSFPPNAWGLHDMAGNVWEWVDESYNKKFKVLRGGSWMDDSSFIPSATSYFVLPKNRSSDIGFRCMKEIPTPSKENMTQKNPLYLQMVDEYDELKGLDELKGDEIPREIKNWNQTRINYWKQFLEKYPNNPYRKEIEEKLRLALKTTGTKTPAERRSKILRITEPLESAVVTSPIKVCFSIGGGYSVEPARNGDNQGKGHHHLLIDLPVPSKKNLDQPMGKNANHIHLGDGSTCKRVKLSKGVHTIRGIFAYGSHRPYVPLITDVVFFYVK